MLTLGLYATITLRSIFVVFTFQSSFICHLFLGSEGLQRKTTKAGAII